MVIFDSKQCIVFYLCYNSFKIINCPIPFSHIPLFKAFSKCFSFIQEL